MDHPENRVLPRSLFFEMFAEAVSVKTELDKSIDKQGAAARRRLPWWARLQSVRARTGSSLALDSVCALPRVVGVAR